MDGRSERHAPGTPSGVRMPRFRDVQHAEQAPMRIRRSLAQLRVRPRYGRRRWTFSDLRPATAVAFAGHVRAGAANALPTRG